MRIRMLNRKLLVALSIISAVMVPCLPAIGILIFPKFIISFGITILGMLYTIYPIRKQITLVKKKNAPIILLLIFAFIIQLLFNHDLMAGDYQYTVYFLSWIIFAMAVSRLDGWIQPLLFFLMFASLVYVFSTYFFYVNEASYIAYVTHRFGEKSSGLLLNYSKGYMSGLLDNYSANGIMISHAVGTCFCLSLYFRGLKKVIMQILFIASAGALLLTAKRGITIYAAIAILVVIYFFYSNKLLQRWLRIGLIIFLAVVILIQAAQFVPDLLNVFERLSIDRSKDLAMIDRANLRSAALKLFYGSPILGIGWRGFMRGGYFSDGDVHNVFIQLLCETGIIGCVIYCTFFFTTYIKTVITLVKFRRSTPSNLKAGWHLAFSLYIQTVFILYCFSGNPLYDLSMLAPYFIGIWIVIYYESVEPSVQFDYQKS